MLRSLLLLLLLLVGCGRSLNLEYLPDREQPVPVAHLPQDYRLKNWLGTNDRGSRGGSCFWASVYMCVRHADRPDVEELLIENRNRGFEGPEHLQSMCRKLDSIGIPWAATEDGDVELLQRASDQRRWLRSVTTRACDLLLWILHHAQRRDRRFARQQFSRPVYRSS